MIVQERTGADVRPDSPVLEDVDDSKDNGPPTANLARRAKSYTDFYHVARAQIKKEQKTANVARRASTERLRNAEVGFQELYTAAADELLDASHEKYQSVATRC